MDKEDKKTNSVKNSPKASPALSRKDKKKEKETTEKPEETEYTPDKNFRPEFYEIPSYVDISRDLSASLPPVIKTLSPEVLEKVKEFREHPEASKYLKEHHHDFYINRWLTARKFDVEKAVELFVASMKWRAEIGADTILEEFPKWKHFEKLAKYWPGSLLNMCPHTFDGSPVMYEALGRCDPKMLDFFGHENVLKFHVYGMEKVQKMYFELTKKHGYFPGIVVIQDLGSVGWNSMSQTVLKVLQNAVQINQNNYPDQLRKMYIVNSPAAVNMVWKAAKLWFDPRTLVKLEFLSGTPASYTQIFGKIIPETDLPKRLGGTSEVDIPPGGPMNGKISDEASDNLPRKSVDIARGSTHTVIVQAEPDDVLQWEFQTAAYDIGFEFAFSEGGGKNDTWEIVSENTRIEAAKEKSGGSHVVLKKGSYRFFWDNSYSWTKGKSLSFAVLKNSEPCQ